MIDSSARIETGAVIGDGVSIGPFCTIGPNVTIGDGCKLSSHVNITGHTTIGPRTSVQPFTSLGTPPQSKRYRGGPTRLIVGTDCDIREGVTMNTGTEDDRGVTEVGDRCYFMAHSHVAHDCKVGNDVIFGYNAGLAGHVVIENNVTFSGNIGVRQFTRIGEGAMIVGMSGIRADVIPWGTVQGPLANLVGLNVVGMRRRGIAKADILTLRRAYETLFFGSGEFRARIDRVAEEYAQTPLVQQVIAFIRAGKRPLTMAVKRHEADEDA
jgi:UDP-N-acetylglucosamine acyltransferase